MRELTGDKMASATTLPEALAAMAASVDTFFRGFDHRESAATHRNEIVRAAVADCTGWNARDPKVWFDVLSDLCIHDKEAAHRIVHALMERDSAEAGRLLAEAMTHAVGAEARQRALDDVSNQFDCDAEMEMGR